MTSRLARCALPLALAIGCATPPPTAATPTTTAATHVSDGTLALLRASMVQRVLREAPGVTRSGVAKLVSMVPLDEKRMVALAEIVSRTLSVERLEREVGARVEAALDGDERAAAQEALARPDIARVIEAAVAMDPPNSELERFIEDPKSLPDSRRALVKALVDVTWSPLVVDHMTRAPVAAAGRIVASAVRDGDDAQRTQLLHISESQRPGDLDALVVAFAFLWRDLDDETLKSATAYFASDVGTKATRVLVEAVLSGIDAVATEIGHEVPR